MSGLLLFRTAEPPVNVSVISEVSRTPVPLLDVKAGSSKVTINLSLSLLGVIESIIGPERSFSLVVLVD